jgi:hypothetical protein
VIDELYKKLEEDELYKKALAQAPTDEERAKIKFHAQQMLNSFIAIAEQIKAEQQFSE